MTDLEERLNAARSAREQANTQIKDLSSKLEISQEKFEKISEEFSELKKINENFVLQVEKLEIQVKQKDEQIQDLDKKLNEIQVENSEFQEQIQSLKDTKTSLVKECEDFKLKVEELNENIKARDLQVKELQGTK